MQKNINSFTFLREIEAMKCDFGDFQTWKVGNTVFILKCDF